MDMACVKTLLNICAPKLKETEGKILIGGKCQTQCLVQEPSTVPLESP